MAESSDLGVFLPLTAVFDPSIIQNLDPNSADFKEFLVLQAHSFNNISQILNMKDTGLYLPVELVNGQKWFSDPTLSAITAGKLPSLRQAYRRVVNFGTLPNAATTTVAHNIVGISSSTTFTRIYGAASDTVAQTYLPLPYVSTVLANMIEVSVDATNVSITTSIDYSAYTFCYIILEYLKD
jgi:hypothetical protein